MSWYYCPLSEGSVLGKYYLTFFTTAYYGVSCAIEHQKQTCAVSVEFVCQYMYSLLVMYQQTTPASGESKKARLYQMLIALSYELVI